MMTNLSSAFILANSTYQEVPASEVVQGRRICPGYRDRYFIRECGPLWEVSQRDWSQFQREENREKYLRHQAKAYGEFNYHAADNNQYSGEELLVDVLTNVENEVLHKMMVERIRETVRLLAPRDKKLLYALFFDGVGEDQYALETGVSRQRVNKRKQDLLAQMKKIIEI